MNDPNNDFELKEGMNVRLAAGQVVIAYDDERGEYFKEYDIGDAAQIVGFGSKSVLVEMIEDGSRLAVYDDEIDYHAEDNDWHNQI